MIEYIRFFFSYVYSIIVSTLNSIKNALLRLYNFYLFQISIQSIIAMILVSSLISIYSLYTLIHQLTIPNKVINNLKSSFLLNTKKLEKHKTPSNSIQNYKKEYKVEGFKYSVSEITQIIEIHVLKKITIANGDYSIKQIAKHKNIKYVIMDCNLSIKCTYFQLIQLLQTLQKFAITISDFNISPKSNDKSDINISFQVPAYEA